MSIDNNEYEEMMSALIDGTDFEVNSVAEVLSSQDKVRTPLESLNCLLGGGIPLSGVFHTYGPPKSGKSTLFYQMMGLFQEQYPDGISVIIDQEASADPVRLEQLGADPSKIIRLPATSVESGFLALLKMLDNKQKNEKIKDTPVFVIWDTISKGLAQDGSTQSRMNAQDRARIIKNYLGQLTSEIEQQPFFLGLINQVIYKTDSYGNTKMGAGGGVALQHENHLSMLLTHKSDEYDPTGAFLMGRWSNLVVDKSKISPEARGIPVYMDSSQGGKIREVDSFVWYLKDTLEFIETAGGWYNIKKLVKYYEERNPFIHEILESYNKSYRYKDLVKLVETDPVIYDVFKVVCMDYIRDHYSLQSKVIEPYYNEVYNRIIESTDPDEIKLHPDNAESDVDSGNDEDGSESLEEDDIVEE